MEIRRRGKELCQEVLKRASSVTLLRARKSKITAAFRALRLDKKALELTKDSLTTKVTQVERKCAEMEAVSQAAVSKSEALSGEVERMKLENESLSAQCTQVSIDKDAWEACCLQAEAEKDFYLARISEAEATEKKIEALIKDNKQLRRLFMKRGAEVSELQSTVAELEHAMVDLKETHASELFAAENELDDSGEENG